MRNDREDSADASRLQSVPSQYPGRIGVGADPPIAAVAHPVPARERFLAQVSEVLSASLDYRETLQGVARLCTGFLADYCLVHVEEAGDVRALGIAHSDASREAELREILRRLPIGSSSRNPVVEVLRTGRPFLIPRVGDAELASLTGARPDGAGLRELGLSTVLIVPFGHGGRTLGAISLARSAGGAPYTSADLSTVEELARRAAPQVDNARLYREARRQAKARERTLNVVSHDLRNALNAAAMHAEMLSDLSPQQLGKGMGRRQMVGLRRALDHMQRLVQDLVDVESIESGRLSLQPEPLDLRALAVEVQEMFAPRARERGIAFVVDMPEPQRRPHADPVRIVQVLTNLVVNALDFTCSGGTVRVSADTDAERLCVCVSDTGAGIAPEDLPYVFERHWRGASSERRTSGSGLGLTIVRGIVQAHGGETWVRSAPGDGSRFYFTLPIDSSATAAG